MNTIQKEFAVAVKQRLVQQKDDMLVKTTICIMALEFAKINNLHDQSFNSKLFLIECGIDE